MTEARIHGEIRDDGPGFDPALRPGRGDEHGSFGLAVVDLESSRWGVRTNGRTSVWLELERA